MTIALISIVAVIAIATGLAFLVCQHTGQPIPGSRADLEREVEPS